VVLGSGELRGAKGDDGVVRNALILTRQAMLCLWIALSLNSAKDMRIKNNNKLNQKNRVP